MTFPCLYCVMAIALCLAYHDAQLFRQVVPLSCGNTKSASLCPTATFIIYVIICTMLSRLLLTH